MSFFFPGLFPSPLTITLTPSFAFTLDFPGGALIWIALGPALPLAEPCRGGRDCCRDAEALLIAGGNKCGRDTKPGNGANLDFHDSCISVEVVVTVVVATPLVGFAAAAAAAGGGGGRWDTALTLLFRSPPDSYNLVFELANGNGGSAFLSAFEGFRRDEGWTQRRSDDAPDKNIYRHASRQGSNPPDDYEMQHDVYSLGVCLLEIGLWGSFVEYSFADRTRSSLRMPPEVTTSRVSTFLIEKGKDHLVSLARAHLPGSMGDKYTEIVETCLTCLGPANVDFGDESEFEIS